MVSQVRCIVAGHRGYRVGSSVTAATWCDAMTPDCWDACWDELAEHKDPNGNRVGRYYDRTVEIIWIIAVLSAPETGTSAYDPKVGEIE